MITAIIRKTRQNPSLGISTRRKTLAFSHIEGGLHAAMVGACEIFSLYYAVKRGFADGELALISTAPMALGALSNWLVPQYVRHHRLKFFLLLSVFTQILGLGGLTYSVSVDRPFWWILISLSLYWIGGMTASPLWIDWMSGWLPNDRIGRYLSRRNGYSAFVSVLAYFGAALWIYKNEIVLQFQTVFAVALFCRLTSLGLLSIQRQPSDTHLDFSEPSKIAKALASNPIWSMILFSVVFRFVASIASPFFLPYMVNEIHFSLFSYAWITIVPYVARALFLNPWGEAVRSFRPFVGLQIAMLISSFVAAAWTFTSHLGMLTVVEGLSGIAWAGVEFCALVILYNFAPRKARGLIGFHLALFHGATLVGAVVGAKILQSGMPSLDLFRLSAALRLIVAVGFIAMGFYIPELRNSFRVYGKFFVSALSFRPSIEVLKRVAQRSGFKS